MFEERRRIRYGLATMELASFDKSTSVSPYNNNIRTHGGGGGGRGGGPGLVTVMCTHSTV